MNNTLIKSAISIATDGASVNAYLPKPLAREVIDLVRELNIMRRFVNTFTMTDRIMRKSKRVSGQSAYYIPDGVTAVQSTISASSITWEAKKLMTFSIGDVEALEDNAVTPDIVSQVLNDAGDALAEAEESSMLTGDPAHLATATTPDSATEANWFNRDPRLVFEGIFTVAATPDAAEEVDAASAELDLDMINCALYNLGKYGRVKNRIVGIVPSDQAAKMRQNSLFKAADTSGLALASFLTGLGSAGEGNSLVSPVYGVPFYEAPFAPSGQIVMYRRDVPQLGDRRLIRIASDEIIESEQIKWVVSERIAFNYFYRDAIVRIKDLDTAVC